MANDFWDPTGFLGLKALTCNELKSPASRPKPDRTLVKAWPAGYENCTFRVVDGGVLLSAKGMPTLFIQEGRLSDSKPSAKYKRMGRLMVYPTAEGVSGGSRDTLPSGSAPSLEESNKAIVDIINGPRRDRAMGLL